MNNKSSYADLIRDWEALLMAIQDNKQALPDIERLRAELEQHLAEVKALKARQDSAAGARQATTQELAAMLTKGRALAIRVRGAIKSEFGHQSERLPQFGVAPFRKRPRRPKGTEENPPVPPGPVSPSPDKEEVKPAQ